MPVLLPVIALATVFSAVLLGPFFSGTTRFLPGVCDRLEPFLLSHLVGQDLAVHQLVDAVCTHVAGGALPGQNPTRPLVLSVHGPPGCGKTFTHTLLARALYNAAPAAAKLCPGQDCLGAKVIFGLDFTLEQQREQLAAVRASILEHVQQVPDPLIVIEEYDKLDCATRSMLRQLIEHPQLLSPTFSRAIILLESNIGFLDMQKLLERAGGDQSKITAEMTERHLKEAVFALWRGAGCEDWQDTVKFSSAIDFFLPYFPLQRPQVQKLVAAELMAWASRLEAEKATQLQWGAAVVNFLAEKVDFDGPYALEGAKQVGNIATRYLSRLVRQCPQGALSPLHWTQAMLLTVKGADLTHKVIAEPQLKQ